MSLIVAFAKVVETNEDDEAGDSAREDDNDDYQCGKVVRFLYRWIHVLFCLIKVICLRGLSTHLTAAKDLLLRRADEEFVEMTTRQCVDLTWLQSGNDRLL